MFDLHTNPFSIVKSKIVYCMIYKQTFLKTSHFLSLFMLKEK